MNNKIYCEIMNRIRKLAQENGEDPKVTTVKMVLITGAKIYAEIGCITLRDSYIEIWNDKDTEFVFVPIVNIVCISV